MKVKVTQFYPTLCDSMDCIVHGILQARILQGGSCFLLQGIFPTQGSNLSILKEINPEYSLEGLILKLKLQYFGHLMQRADSLEKTPMLGKIEGGRGRGQQRMRRLDGITNSVDMSLSEL